MASSVASKYQVRWREQGDEGWSNPVDAPVVNEIAVEGLDRQKVYEFQVRAVSSCGAKSVWVGSDYTVPDAPALDAPTALTAKSVADGVALAWSMPSEQASSVEYVVEKAAGSSGPWSEVTRVRSLQWTDPVIDEVVNWYRVKAINFAGEASAYSNLVNENGVSIAAVIAASSGVKLINPSFESGLIGWTAVSNAAGISSYASEPANGAKCLRRNGNDGGSDRTDWLNDREFSLAPGERAKLSFKVRSAGTVPNGTVYFFWHVFAENGDFVGAGATAGLPGGAYGYTTVAYILSGPASGISRFKVGFAIRNHTVGSYLIDDYAMEFLASKTEETPFYLGSGQRLGDARNQAMVTVGNYGSAWSGLSITYSSTTSSATLTASAATLQAGGSAIAYNQSQVTVSGSAGSTRTYYLYYVDVDYSGGSKTLNATTTYINSINADGKVLVGTVTITYPTSGTGSGGGPRPDCVSVDAWVIRRTGSGWEFVRAGSVEVGDYLRVIDPATGAERWGLVTMSHSAMAECVRVVAANGGALTCSTTAPLGVLGGQALAPDTVGQALAGRFDGSFGHSPCMESTPVGEMLVQHITCENDYFLAGDDQRHLFAHHNIKNDDGIG